jgi:hypothetical protein
MLSASDLSMVCLLSAFLGFFLFVGKQAPRRKKTYLSFNAQQIKNFP